MDIQELFSQELFSGLAVALGIGLLIGLERGWRTREVEPGSRAAGIRTFAITGLLDGTTGALANGLSGAANAGGGIVLAVAFASYAAIIGHTHARREPRSRLWRRHASSSARWRFG